MKAPWKLQLRDGSFRGVRFFVDSHDYEGGRRLAEHVFPYKDDPYHEDMGRRGRQFRVSCYLLGADYFPMRDALIEALEKEGAGILVHPYLGSKTVKAGEYTLSETRAEGGIAMFSIQFFESTDQPEPAGIKDLISDAKAKASALQLALARAFSAFNSPNSTSFVFQSAQTLIQGLSDGLAAASAAMPKGNAQAIADLTYSIRNLKANSRDLVQRPQALADSINGAVNELAAALSIEGLFPEDDRGRVVINPADYLSAAALGASQRQVFFPIIDFRKNLPPIYQTTLARKTEANNQNLMRQLVTGSALAQLTVVSASTPYATHDEAIAQRDFIITEIDRLLADPTLPDEVYSSLQDMQTSAIEAIPNPQAVSPRLSLIEIGQPMPSLVIAYELYESLELETDIVLRNRVKHPGFIPSSRPLEVISGD